MKLRKSVKFSIALLFFLSAYAICAQAGWQFVSPMPHGRYGHDAALGPDGKIYVMGGMVFEIKNERMTYTKYNDGRYSNLVYDPQDDTWHYLEPVPGWRGEPNRWMTYDQEKKEWQYHKYEHGMTIPENVRKTDIDRQGNGVSIVTGKDGKIYWIGGMGRYEWLGRGENNVFPYDPLNSAWALEVIFKRVPPTGISYSYEMILNKDIPDLGERRIDHRAVITSDGRIYVLGGYRIEERENLQKRGGYELVSVATNTVECYNPDTNKWEYKKSLPFKEIILFAAVVGPDDKIYVFGGAAELALMHSTPVLDSTVVYDPKTDTWSTRRSMPAPRNSSDAVLGADGKIYIIGGTAAVKGPPLNDVFVYDPVNDSWQKGPSMNYPRGSPAAVATPDGKIYVTGGTDVGAYKTKEKLNILLPRSKKLYTGKVQDTVEVLDISN